MPFRLVYLNLMLCMMKCICSESIKVKAAGFHTCRIGIEGNSLRVKEGLSYPQTFSPVIAPKYYVNSISDISPYHHIIVL